MKRRLPLGLVTLATVAATFPAAHSPSVQAQPVASIALPAPGAPEELYAGCNLLALTFPDGTPTGEVVEAVTPTGAIEALWRYDAALGTFEGFSPVFPRASDLLTVSFLEPVWICRPRPLGPPPTPTPTPAPAPWPTPTPTPAPWSTADLAITQLFATSSPAGDIRARITNNGPGALNIIVQLACTVGVNPYGAGIPSGQGVGSPIAVTLSPGQTGEFATGISVDTSKARYDVTCTIQVDFNDPNMVNNNLSRVFPTADLAVTDIFPDSLPNGEIYMRITNNGPDSLTNAGVHLGCSALVTNTVGGETVLAGVPGLITVSLNPGQTKEFITLILVDNSCAKYDVTCEINASFNDPNTANDSYSEEIPLWSGGGWRCPY